MLPSQAQSKSFAGPEGHETDWYECLGIEDQASRAKARPLFESISREIDDVDAFCQLLKRKYFQDSTDFRCDTGYHRALFHWGFNADPIRSKTIKRSLHNLSETEKAALKEELIKEQQRRNKRIIAQVERLTGVPNPRSRALATIIYDIHILGDYETREIASLMDTAAILNDIENQGIRRLRFDTEHERQILEDLDKAYKQGLDDRAKAANLLSVLKERFPNMIFIYYRQTFLNKGISIADKQINQANNTILDRILNPLKNVLSK